MKRNFCVFAMCVVTAYLVTSQLVKANVDICEPTSFYDDIPSTQREKIDDLVQASQGSHEDFFGQPCNLERDTPLHLAIRNICRFDFPYFLGYWDQVETVLAIIESGSPLNSLNIEGQTPLDLVKSRLGVSDVSHAVLDDYASTRRVFEDEDIVDDSIAKQQLCLSVPGLQLADIDDFVATMLNVKSAISQKVSKDIAQGITPFNGFPALAASRRLRLKNRCIGGLLNVYQKLRQAERHRNLLLQPNTRLEDFDRRFPSHLNVYTAYRHLAEETRRCGRIKRYSTFD